MWWLPARLTWDAALPLPDQLGDLCKQGTLTCQDGHEVHLQGRPLQEGKSYMRSSEHRAGLVPVSLTFSS